MHSVYSLAADGVLVLHSLVVLFNVGALPLIWLGYFRKWDLVRDPWFRIGHLALLGYVVAETAFGAVCPLTHLENLLRIKAGQTALYDGGFLAYWLHNWIYWDISQSVFVLLYISFFALVALTFVKVKPRLPRWFPGRASETHNAQPTLEDSFSEH